MYILSNTYVLPLKDATHILEMLEGAMVYEHKYRRQEDGGSTYHIYPPDTSMGSTLDIMNDEAYRLAKLAGKPVEEEK